MYITANMHTRNCSKLNILRGLLADISFYPNLNLQMNLSPYQSLDTLKATTIKVNKQTYIQGKNRIYIKWEHDSLRYNISHDNEGISASYSEN